MKKRSYAALALVAVVGLVFGLIGGIAGNYVSQKWFTPAGEKEGTGTGTGTSYEQTGTNITINPSNNYTLAEGIAEKLLPSVVSVTTTYEVQYSYGWGWSSDRTYKQEYSCVGTGFIVTTDGYIVTNSHVVNDGDYKTINIGLYNAGNVEGTVLWADETLDLAVVKINVTGLTAAELGDSDTVKLGSYAAAIGNPLGLTFERSITQGIISGLDRTITVSSDSSSTGITMEGLFQTDAAINSGNSGGPLLNSSGQVIAIASARASDGESMGFAIPINVIKPILAQIMETGSYERLYLGITAIGIEQQSSVSSSALIEYYGSGKGIYIYEITKGGGADEAGLKSKDIITKVAGVEVGTMNKLYKVLINYHSGDYVEVEYLRNGATHTAQVKLLTAAEIN